jgi:hypothetical protein
MAGEWRPCAELFHRPEHNTTRGGGGNTATVHLLDVTTDAGDGLASTSREASPSPCDWGRLTQMRRAARGS